MWHGKTSLVTAHIIYRMPDRLSILQEFIWQNYDALPDFPALTKGRLSRSASGTRYTDRRSSPISMVSTSADIVCTEGDCQLRKSQWTER